jgi:hypothetical protein
VIIDRETFTELAIHLKLASDAILEAGRRLTGVSGDGSRAEERCAGALGDVTTLAIELIAMERILRAVMQANRDEERGSAAADSDQPSS